LKDFRRIATRYDRLARNYLASVCLGCSCMVDLMSLDPSKPIRPVLHPVSSNMIARVTANGGITG
jgi:hypothetical protein